MRNEERMIGDSAALASTLDQVSQVAGINRPVLVVGERGTGKELIAQRLHFLSGRWDAPLVKVNCAAMAESLLESELFGHEPGAFTGASRTHKGRFERADGGTLFLDELATMSLRLQEKLLRLVEYGEFERLGGQQTLRVDVRVIGATNVDLQQLAASGQFRADLLDRLSFDVIHLPALRQRQEGIPELARHFAMQMCTELGWELFPGFSADALETLLQHPWPGNVRELKNAVERSLYRWAQPQQPVAEIVIDPFLSPFEDAGPDGSATQDKSPDSAAGTSPIQAPGQSPPGQPGFSERIMALERELLEQALAKHGHNQRATASALDLSYDQLRGLVRKHQLGGRRRASVKKSAN